MNQPEEQRFTELVGQQLPTDDETARSLWMPIAEEFDRDGPEAAIEFLNARRQMLEERTKKLLDEYQGM